jgi:hypothetical protein
MLEEASRCLIVRLESPGLVAVGIHAENVEAADNGSTSIVKC